VDFSSLTWFLAETLLGGVIVGELATLGSLALLNFLLKGLELLLL